MRCDHRRVKFDATLRTAITGILPREDSFMARPKNLIGQVIPEPFQELARQLRQDVEEQARRHGRAPGAAVPSAIAA
jgi:hypothetical protein